MSRSAMCATPPMGWNTWNTFTENINEQLVRDSVDAMKTQGLGDAGYEYVVIDDCWSERERDANGLLVADRKKFPHGMKAVADYVHEQGFKFGMYSCCGTRTCADYPASFGHEYEDARQFAEWGVDYLKYDNCYRVSTLNDPLLYRRMGLALANCGRDIVFSACQWGTENVHDWIRSTGAHLFRSTGDIQNCWRSVRDIAVSQLNKPQFSGPYCHNDMDMLVVGMGNQGGNGFIAAGGCTDEEYQTHFALWCMMNSPLMIGCDIRNLSDGARNILLNKEMIAIDQDIECRSFYCLGVQHGGEYHEGEAFILIKPLSTGEIAIGMFNIEDGTKPMAVNFWDLGLPAVGMGLQMRDVIAHEDLGVRQERIRVDVPAHGCKVYRCELVTL